MLKSGVNCEHRTIDPRPSHRALHAGSAALPHRDGKPSFPKRTCPGNPRSSERPERSCVPEWDVPGGLQMTVNERECLAVGIDPAKVRKLSPRPHRDSRGKMIVCGNPCPVAVLPW